MQSVKFLFRRDNNSINFFLDFFVQTEATTTLTQTITLSAGTNWFSTYLDITLEELQAALEAALPEVNTGITIKSKSGNSTLRNGRWRNTTFVWDVAKMYRIEVPEACELTLTGMPIDPAEHPITIVAGEATWIGFPFSESKTLDQAIPTGFAVSGDVIKSKDGNARYTNGRWRTTGFDSLEPGMGYIYNSAATAERTLTYPTGTK